MRMLEQVSNLVVGAALVVQATTSGPRAVVAVAAAVGLLPLVIHAVTGRFRWQLLPVSLVAVVLLGVSWQQWEPGPWLSAAAVGVGAVLVIVSVALTIGLPIPAVVAPSGPLGVGMYSTMLHRPMTGSGDEPDRALGITVWFPAAQPTPPEKGAAVARWEEFGDPEQFPMPIRALSQYLRKSAAFAQRGPEPADLGKIIVYNHGLISIAADNSILMEELASHGYTIVAVRHLNQQGEYRALSAAADPAESAAVADLNARLMTPLDSTERAALSAELYRRNTAMAELVARRTADTVFVLDRLPSLLGDLDPISHGNAVTSVAAVGLSIGGAVSTELAKLDARVRAVVNLDGGIYGHHTDHAIAVPYLMLYSALNSASNDTAKNTATSDYVEHTYDGAKHLNFHDASILFPGLKWIKLLGPVDGQRHSHQTNRDILQFLDETNFADV